MLFIDHKYINLLSNRLERFKRQGNSSYLFRCPICGDSQKSKIKARGYIYEKSGKMLFYCHNCNASMSFGKFLEWIDQTLYKDYKTEKYLEKRGENLTPKPTADKVLIHKFPKRSPDSPLSKLKKISQLRHDHPAKIYISNRRIPSDSQYKLFFCTKFKEWVNQLIPEKFTDTSNDEPRLILPFLDESGTCYGFQGRSFRKDGIRYITIMLDNDKPKVFGLDAIKFSEKFYITEGPIDSLFLKNSIAMAGSDVDVERLCAKEEAIKNAIFVYDNEPRNKQIVKKMESVINKGYNIVIWPEALQGVKDINDMVLRGYNPTGMVEQFTYQGMKAKLKFVEWKKI